MVTTLTIRGMLAKHAVREVFTALTAVEGIARADVTMGRAVIEHDGRASVEALSAAIAVAGYEVLESREERRVLPLL